MSLARPELDLNLLRVFAAVLREGSITLAGQQLGMSQSALSHALARLRRHFGDPLFVRTTAGMRPTAHAQALAATLVPGLDLIRQGLAQQPAFDPASAQRSFRILTTDVAEMLFFPRLVVHLRQAAPGVTLLSGQAGRSQYREALESGAADLAIGRLPALHHDFHQQHLFDVPMVCMLRRDHPSIGEQLSMEDFLQAWQVTIDEPAQAETIVRRALGARADKRRITLGMTHYVSVPAILAETDLIAAMPQVFGEELMARHGLKTLPLPFEVPGIEVRQFWHERSHQEPGHRWLRRVIAELFANAAPG